MITILERIPTRKNRVYKVLWDSRFAAAKLCADAEKEFVLGRKLWEGGCPVPEPLDYRKKLLLTEWVEGEMLLDRLEKMENAPPGALRHPPQGGRLDGDPAKELTLLAEWIIRFRSVTGLCHGDMNLRNFILSDGKLFGLDFEDAGPGGELRDAGQAAAFLLLYDPALTPWKRNAARIFLDKYAELTSAPWLALWEETERQKKSLLRRRKERRDEHDPHTGKAE